MEKEELIHKMNGEVYKPSKILKNQDPETFLTISDQEILNSLNLKLQYDAKWCIELVRYCSSGNSLESFCAKFKINPLQIEKWMDIDEFKAAIQMARAAEIHYWEERLKTALSSEEVDPNTGEITTKVDLEILKICKFKLENLGYNSKLTEGNKVLFKENLNKKSKRIGVPLKAEQDLAEQTQEEIDSLTDLYLGVE